MPRLLRARPFRAAPFRAAPLRAPFRTARSFRILLIAALLAGPLACGGRAPHGSGAPEFSVFVTGGLNNQLEPCGCHDRLGGHVRRATLFKEFGRSHPQARVLYLDAGQAFKMDSPEVPYSVPSMLEAMTALHLDALNPGIYETSTGLAPLVTALSRAPFRLTSANLRRIDNNEPLFPPYLILTPHRADSTAEALAGPKVGVVGLTVLERYRVLDGVGETKAHFIDPLKAAGEVLPGLAGQADAVIAIGNFGRGVARDLAALKTVDLIVATDLHIQDETSDPGQPTPIYFTGVLGKRQYRFDFYRNTARQGGRWRVIGNITAINDSLLPDPSAQQLMQRYSDAAAAAGYGRGVSVRGKTETGS